MTARRLASAAALIPLALLAACGSEPDAPPPEAPVEEVVPVEASPAPPPAPPPANVAAIEEPSADLPPDEQVLEDADATGMTARVDRSEGADEATAPTEDVR